MKAVGSHCSLSLLFMMKVIVWHFACHFRKVITNLIFWESQFKDCLKGLIEGGICKNLSASERFERELFLERDLSLGLIEREREIDWFWEWMREKITTLKEGYLRGLKKREVSERVCLHLSGFGRSDIFWEKAKIKTFMGMLQQVQLLHLPIRRR